MAGRLITHILVNAGLAAAGVIGTHLQPRQASNLTIEQCPGYAASNVQYSNGRPVSADLSLAGTACNTYGTDLTDLKLVVEYQTSEPGRCIYIRPSSDMYRHTIARQDLRCRGAGLSDTGIRSPPSTDR